MSKKKDKMDQKYKVKNLKVYGSPESLADGKRKYRMVFDRQETTYIYADFSFYNKLFDEEDWEAEISLKAYDVTVVNDQREVCDITKKVQVLKSENTVHIREGWGNATPGVFWQEGTYKWEARINGKLVKNAFFYIEDLGQVTNDFNPYFNLVSVKLFEAPYELPPANERVYGKKFNSAETRYIWVEIEIESTHPKNSWNAEFLYNFYNDSRQLKGSMTKYAKVNVSDNNKHFTIVTGWGTNDPGFWVKDNYTLEVIFMEQLIALVPFECGDEFVEGTPERLEGLPVESSALGHPETAEPMTEEEIFKELDELIGLKSIKKRVQEYAAYLKYVKLRIDKGIEDSGRIDLNAVFTGNPGTGKTTVAKMLGKIYKNLGLLSKDTVHEVDRSDLIGEFIGQTAPKVKDAIKKARGGILFIDEAYSLARSAEDKKDFGREAIEILIKEMSDGPGNLAIIVAGYPEEMRIFINSNPGLKSRFNIWYEFPDYMPDELLQIAEYSAGKKSLKMEENAKELLYENLLDAYRNRDKYFGNARYAISLIDEAKFNLGIRVMQNSNPMELTKEEISTITVKDIENIIDPADRRKLDIPVDEDLLKEAMEELNSLVGLSTIKNEVSELIKLVRFYREVKKDILSTFSMHSVFLGNPGTGKTTIARILSKVYKALGLLERGHLVECDREGLVAGYVGQTAIKTSEKIEEAQGGVLFIDEAYALTPPGSTNDFGREAIEILLKQMEDKRGQFALIVAGYTGEMKLFLESNPGLKSRFDKIYKFPDYTAEELFQIALLMYFKEGIKPDSEARAQLQEYFEYNQRFGDKYFGNARFIRKVVQESIRNQNLRLAELSPEKRTKDMIRTLTLEDVKEFKPSEESMEKKFKMGFRVDD